MSGRTVKATLVGINRDYGENDFRSVVLCCLGRGISRQNPHKDCRNSDGAAAVKNRCKDRRSCLNHSLVTAPLPTNRCRATFHSKPLLQSECGHLLLAGSSQLPSSQSRSPTITVSTAANSRRHTAQHAKAESPPLNATLESSLARQSSRLTYSFFLRPCCTQQTFALRSTCLLPQPEQLKEEDSTRPLLSFQIRQRVRAFAVEALLSVLLSSPDSSLLDHGTGVPASRTK